MKGHCSALLRPRKGGRERERESARARAREREYTSREKRPSVGMRRWKHISSTCFGNTSAAHRNTYDEILCEKTLATH